eukprot:CAMPEP_0182421652 /NCGR_PEP_ID=MMETSP1167-20130531/7079_1 /TAXON_ID=2988 /ORGANISM="Mallomonas Sp, Strain CCMP3275" /LENGTH=577 /DNA_ID=CAMNT_0024598967 /DNA_START=219 /DNA_END=1952 /DNA_ORIENTATION=+
MTRFLVPFSRGSQFSPSSPSCDISALISSCQIIHPFPLFQTSGDSEIIEGTEIIDDETEITSSEPNIEEIMSMVFNDEHKKELSRKVEEAMLEDWDLKEGVNTAPRSKPLPLKVNIDIWSYTARTEFSRGNYTGAMTLYQRCIDYNPCDGRPWLGLARIYWKRGDTARAERMYKDGLYYNPKNPYLLQGWAVMLEKMGKVEQAVTLLSTSVRSSPTHAASWVALARLHQRFGKTDEARYCLSSAVSGDPKSYVALHAWAVLESQAGDVMKSRELFKKCLEVSPRSVHGLQAWATLERREGNLEIAEKLIRRAISIFPESSRVLVSLAEVFELRGEFQEAYEIYETGGAKAERSGDAGFFQSWALFEHRRGVERERESSVSEVMIEANRAKVRKLFKKAIMVNKKHSASWIAWSKYEEKAGNVDVARRLLVAGVSNFPHSRNIGWFHCCLAHLSRQQNDINTARACYKRALEATSPQQSLRVLLEFCRMEIYHGDANAAVKLHELAIRRFPKEDRVWKSYLELEKRRRGGDVSALSKRRLKIQGSRSQHNPYDDSVLETDMWESGSLSDDDSFLGFSS